ncbi:MAG: [Fe-Fe] hydrogenase large subunit C-terminal domain-containing protein, partial [Solobacterium sp.]|nr:[Fe-Fe] hydrogenase large subunit C-terminal domain-containing protein [Solobacterium sp.]
KNNIDPKDMVVVSLMPCTAKKREILRIQERIEGDIQPTDYSMTVKEFISMVKRFGLDIKNLPDGEFDDPLGESTGAADIFAQTGGVMEAAIRTAGSWLDGDAPWNVDWETGYDAGVKEATVKVGGIDLNLCIVSGLANARKVLEKVKSGEKNYHFIEVMACPGGCLNGGGQPIAKDGKYAETVKMRRAGIQAIDKGKSARISCDSPAIKQVYAEFFEKPGSHLAHELLHTSYADEFDKL